MKSVPTVLSDAIRQDYVLQARPRLTADWNMNRYKTPTANNILDDEENGYDPDIYPISSIIEPIRPTKGIIKARVGEGAVSNDYNVDSSTRYYIGGPDDIYKYWTSPHQSDGSGFISDCEPYVTYARAASVNKIVVKLENTIASPTNYKVQVQYSPGGSWSTVSTNPTIRSDGQVIIYYNGIGWSSNKPSDLTDTVTIYGIKFVVTRLGPGMDKNGYVTTDIVNGWLNGTTGYYSFFNLIAIEGHLELDLSDRLISVSDEFDYSDTSQLYPVGTLTSNSGEVTLDNLDGFFDRENQFSSLDSDLLEPNVEFNLEYVYTVQGMEFSVQQFVMYGDAFKGQKDDTVSVSLADFSKYLQDTTPLPAMHENVTAPEAMWRVLDSVGFVNYAAQSDDRVVNHRLPVFYVDGTQSVWEVLDELAQATQSAVYFDSYGMLQIKTRDAAFDSAQNPVWTLRGEDSNNELADIIQLSQTEEFEPNYITVSYQSAKWSDFSNGNPSMQKVWEPEEETLVLRASSLQRAMDINDTYIILSQNDVTYWPYSGKVNIDGEIISYDGKQYIYYDGDYQAKVVNITSEEEKTNYDLKSSAGRRYQNYFTGALKISERGVWNSETKAHKVDASGYNTRKISGSGSSSHTDNGFIFNRGKSTVTLRPVGFKDWHEVLFATRGSMYDSPFYYYGAKFKFNKGSGFSTQIAGLVINNSGSKEDGYFVEFRPTGKIDAKSRLGRNEVLLYSQKSGQHYRIGGDKGAAINVAEDVEYEVDIYIKDSGYVSLWVNGRRVLAGSVPAKWQVGMNGRFGMFAKGKTSAEFEYIYAIAKPGDSPADDFSFLDAIYGGYRGGLWDREWVYGWHSLSRRKRKKSGRERARWNQRFFDDFGPYVHEIREFDIKFDPMPVLQSYVYLSNDWDAICTEYSGNPFGARFVLANAGRENAVINGEDSLQFDSTSRTTKQVLTVFGRALVMSETATEVAQNDNAIQKRGKIESELTSKWIQSESMAKDLANWISSHWGSGCDEQSVEIFGNPLIELGDVVSISYERKHMSPVTHKYFVTGISTSFETGLSTTLTLRRVV